MVTVIGSSRSAATATAKAAPSSVSLRASWSTSTTWFGRANMPPVMKAVCAIENPPSRARAPKPIPAANRRADGTDTTRLRPWAKAPACEAGAAAAAGGRSPGAGSGSSFLGGRGSLFLTMVRQ
jgi:hypothetical protein